ncbi:Superoxide dismutase [Cu-Zn] [Prionace glauca] [Rhizoctonia solani]|uniref:Superoxide dismutase [Cu-Zn] n=1 Tax=Rhizoctonia solani TaxID=456999 RepID=A0A0K6GDV5_9AGAM|nr:Superoxide dismutase [Cu-Zn] [Prionace glauca] [Rhizoctonia solani]
MLRFFFLTVLAASVLLPLVSCGYNLKATVVMLKNGSTTAGSVGSLEFEESKDGTIHLHGTITGLSAGKHGIHVHTWGDISAGCESVGGHFNPYNTTHGGPKSAVRHVGDLGNIRAGSDGMSKVDIYDKVISLSGETNIIGRGLVIHAGEDDLGLGKFNDSLLNGHSGPRFACGVIGLGNATNT